MLPSVCTRVFLPYSDLYIELDDNNDSPEAAKVYTVPDFYLQSAVSSMNMIKNNRKQLHTQSNGCCNDSEKGLPVSG